MQKFTVYWNSGKRNVIDAENMYEAKMQSGYYRGNNPLYFIDYGETNRTYKDNEWGVET